MKSCINPNHASCHVPSENTHYMRTMIFMQRRSCWPWTNRTFVCTVACLNLKVLSLVFDTVYEVVSDFTLDCYFAFHIHYDGDDDSVLIFVAWMYVCMRWRCRVGSARSARTFVLLLCMWTSIKGDYKVFDAVYEMSSSCDVNTLQWQWRPCVDDLRWMYGTAVSWRLALHNQHVRQLVCLYCCAFRFEVLDTVWVRNLTFMCCPNIQWWWWRLYLRWMYATVSCRPWTNRTYVRWFGCMFEFGGVVVGVWYARSVCTLLCLYWCAFKFEVFDTAWVRTLTFWCCPNTQRLWCRFYLR